MQATNWSLILNVLLLIGVIVAIGRLMKARRLSLNPEKPQPAAVQPEKAAPAIPSFNDDIIAVRKVDREVSSHSDEEKHQAYKKPVLKSMQPRLTPREPMRTERDYQPRVEVRAEPKIDSTPALNVTLDRAEPVAKAEPAPTSLMMFLLAKENRQFAGYELLQTVLAAGLRFGEGHLFHRHQFANGQGPVLCSLAAATASGVFDLQNIGAFSVRGLCLFMHASNNASIDADRFAIMLETGRQLSDGLDAYLLDSNRKPLTEERIAQYHRALHIETADEELEIA